MKTEFEVLCKTINVGTAQFFVKAENKEQAEEMVKNRHLEDDGKVEEGDSWNDDYTEEDFEAHETELKKEVGE